jgi:hypothetical protein
MEIPDYIFLETHQDVDGVVAVFEKIQQRAGSLLQPQESSQESQP